MASKNPYEESPYIESQIDLYMHGRDKAHEELTRIKKSLFYQRAAAFYKASLMYDPNNGIIGWRDSDLNSWTEVWAYRLEGKENDAMQRWSYMPENGVGTITTEEDTVLVDPIEAPYYVLKTVAYHTEKRS